ncbi:MAG: hypothetical protein JOZ27_03255, partial [Caulobacteraceae bacterium]|nr:hypothetical protein [Caulobacteraceae bacterium]
DLATAKTLLAGLELEASAAFAAGELVGAKACEKGGRIARAAKALDRLAEAEPFWA